MAGSTRPIMGSKPKRSSRSTTASPSTIKPMYICPYIYQSNKSLTYNFFYIGFFVIILSTYKYTVIIPFTVTLYLSIHCFIHSLHNSKACNSALGYKRSNGCKEGANQRTEDGGTRNFHCYPLHFWPTGL